MINNLIFITNYILNILMIFYNLKLYINKICNHSHYKNYNVNYYYLKKK